jgi:hypothetical protein
MSDVFQNIDSPPPSPPSECVPPPLVRGEDTLAGWRGGGGVNIWEDADTALYSTYVSTLWVAYLCTRIIICTGSE